MAVGDVLHRRSRLLVLAKEGRIEPGDLVAADLGALTGRGEEGAAVVPRAAVVRRGVQRDEAGQVGVLTPQAVQRPGPDRRAHELEAAGVHLHERLRVIRQVGVHAVDETEVVGVPGQVGEDL